MRFSARFRETKNPSSCTRKRVCGITEFAWSSLGTFIVFTSSRSCACVLHRYGQHAREKVAHRTAFPRAGKLPARGNAFMEMVTEKCTRTTFSLAEKPAETRTWKARLIRKLYIRIYAHKSLQTSAAQLPFSLRETVAARSN